MHFFGIIAGYARMLANKNLVRRIYEAIICDVSFLRRNRANVG